MYIMLVTIFTRLFVELMSFNEICLKQTQKFQCHMRLFTHILKDLCVLLADIMKGRETKHQCSHQHVTYYYEGREKEYHVYFACGVHGTPGFSCLFHPAASYIAINRLFVFIGVKGQNGYFKDNLEYMVFFVTEIVNAILTLKIYVSYLQTL